MSRKALRNTLFLLISVILLSAAIELRNSERGPRDRQWERLQHQGFIVIGVDPTIPPFGQFGEDAITGFDPALAQIIGQRLGLQVYLTPLSFDGLYDSLLLGYVDVVIAALRPDPFRTDVLRYTTPYFDAGHVLVSASGVTILADLTGQTLAVEYASEGDLLARQHPALTIERYFTAEEALTALDTGTANAALVDKISAHLYLADHPENKMSLTTLVPDPYVIAVRRSDWRLHRALEQILADLRRDGTLAQLTAVWLSGAQTALSHETE